MEYYHRTVLEKSGVLEALSPNEVSRLLVAVLSMEHSANQIKTLMPKQIRFIHGCLGRTPANFYDKVSELTRPYSDL